MSPKRSSKRQAKEPQEPPPRPPEANEAERGQESAAPAAGGSPVVGIGASAGGLAAFEELFSAMPADTDMGMAFVLVQHLSPDHKSNLTELVQRYTRMQVFEVEDGMAVQPNCVYVIPPNRDMAFLNGTLQLLEPDQPRGLRLPIDSFFRSLAQDQHERAICIVLSGTGSDGSLGARAVKGEGGMVMAQSPESTEYDGMPRGAINTGVVDYVLTPAEMPAQLLIYAAHSFVSDARPRPAPTPGSRDALKKICVLLRARTGHDFSGYKHNTILRRVQRRMALHQIEDTGSYLRQLQESPLETDALFQDMLIGVTSFFRDPEAFEALREQVAPQLFDGKSEQDTVRVWVCGASTGEEAYSIAILLQEHMEATGQGIQAQIFATDVDGRAIEQARRGAFPASIAADVPAPRLARYFTHDRDAGVYRIKRVIRDLVVFSEQDVIRDPPFSKLDLVSCRNLLIYMGAGLQKRVLQLFHYALRPSGVLFLGSSETVGELATHFSSLDSKWKVYQRLDDPLGPAEAFTGPALALTPGRPPTRRPARPVAQTGTEVDLRSLTEQSLLDESTRVGILVDGRGEILFIHGRTGQYLEPAPGDSGMNVLTMAREGLARELTTALRQVVVQKAPVRHQGLRVRTNGDLVGVDLTVRPVTRDAPDAWPADLFLVVLEPAPSASQDPPGADAEEAGAGAAEGHELTAELEKELRAKEEYLQAAMEEMETTNEELQSANEELQSANEELQSTNEELETSKEELQSVNEELATVNAELQTKVGELSQVSDDLTNLLAGTGVATVFLDNQLRIARFTPTATRLINLIESDVGRPVGHLVSNLVGYDRLVEDVRAVLDDLTPVEIEVQTTAGAWYMMSIRPYRTLENVIEGAVITFVDTSQMKRAQLQLRDAEEFARGIVDTVSQPLLVLDDGLRVASANRAFYSAFQESPETTVGRSVFDLGDRRWDIAELRDLLEGLPPGDVRVEDIEVGHAAGPAGRRKLVLRARRIVTDAGETRSILLAIDDGSGAKPLPGAGGEEAP